MNEEDMRNRIEKYRNEIASLEKIYNEQAQQLKQIQNNIAMISEQLIRKSERINELNDLLGIK